MKKVLLVAALVLISTISYSQSVISLFGKANEFFSLLEAGKYDTAHTYFAESEQAKITAANLQQLWTNIKKNLGNSEYIDPVQSKAQGDAFAVTVEAKFERGMQNFVLVFNKGEKLIGLYLPPKVASYETPLYADTNLYVEKQVYLVTGTHQLAAIVTTPKNKAIFPMVVFVHGSGPGDMDETVGPNKPFKDIALGLATKGVGSIRYVKRTLVYPNEFIKAFTVKEEVIDDAVSAVALAKTIKGADIKNIYVFGHSLGGMLAPKIASLAPDVKGIILAAAPARKLTDIIIDQNKYIVAVSRDTTTALKKELAQAISSIEKSRITQLAPGMKPDSVVVGLPASYWVDINSYDQVAAAKALNKRIFVIQGGNDFQVGETDYNIWNAALGKKPNAKVKWYITLNHLLSVQMEKGTSKQYQKPINVDVEVVDDIVAWVNTP